MLVKNEVEIHEKSVEYVKGIFEMYTEVNVLSDVIENPIIHMYPKEDTIDDLGSLNGYNDAIFFTVDIYDTKNMTVYKGKKYHDGIMPFDDIYVSQIKIFKDLSTLVSLRGEYNIELFQGIDIKKVS